MSEEDVDIGFTYQPTKPAPKQQARTTAAATPEYARQGAQPPAARPIETYARLNYFKLGLTIYLAIIAVGITGWVVVFLIIGNIAAMLSGGLTPAQPRTATPYTSPFSHHP